MEHENQNVEEINHGDIQLKNESKQSTSTSVLELPKSSLPNIFYEDKATETQFDELFEFPQILNSNEKLIHFTGKRITHYYYIYLSSDSIM